MRTLVFALGLIATQAAAADRFDLVCTSKKENVRYRIDLAAGEYCFDQCKNVLKIAEVTSGTITFYNDEPSPPDNERRYARVNRLTGEWEIYSYAPRYASFYSVHGLCEPSPFSGIASINRKF